MLFLIFFYFNVFVWMVVSKPIQQFDEPFSFDKPGVLPYSTDDCDFNPDPYFGACLYVCKLDNDCQSLGFNRTQIPCACPAEICKDGKIYGFPSYKRGLALTDEQLKHQPHVKAPCNGCVTFQISPFYQQIGNCNELNQTCSNGGQVLPKTKTYYPGNDIANFQPGLNPAQSLTNPPPKTGSGSGSG